MIFNCGYCPLLYPTLFVKRATAENEQHVHSISLILDPTQGSISYSNRHAAHFSLESVHGICEEADAMKPPVSPESRVILHRYADGACISIDNTIVLSPPQQWGDHGVLLIRSHHDVETCSLPSRLRMARPLVRPAYLQEIPGLLLSSSCI